MTCERLRGNLTLYAGGDLDDARALRELEQHLAACEGCRAELDALRAALGDLRSAAVTEESLPAEDPEYWHEVESKLRERALGIDKLRLGRAGWRSVPAVLAQAAMVLIVAGATMWLLARESNPSRPTAPTATARLETREAPTVVLVRAPDQYGNVDVTSAPAGSDVIYSDFNHVIRPAQARYVREQVMPAVYAAGAGPF